MESETMQNLKLLTDDLLQQLRSIDPGKASVHDQNKISQILEGIHFYCNRHMIFD